MVVVERKVLCGKNARSNEATKLQVNEVCFTDESN